MGTLSESLHPVAVIGLGCILFGAWCAPGWADPATAPVSKTGQIQSYGAGDDGQLEKGVAWPVPRFTDAGDGTIVDHLTSLVWMKNANCWDRQTWESGLNLIAGLNAGSQTCAGYTSGRHTDWRLPNVDELQSLLDFSRTTELPAGHPFVSVQNSYYWSSTTYAANSNNAWTVSFATGYVGTGAKPNISFIWPVRGGQ
ncbi:MAG: DUF1566 domain-containing protein [Magnetococcales bacterium]|nr:DUF1566 domain-containing protein [Magnetococcales bacterium]